MPATNALEEKHYSVKMAYCCLQAEEHEAVSVSMQDQLDKAHADCQSLHVQLSAASHELYKSDAQLQASKLDMTYLKVRRQLSQSSPVLSYVQAYEVSCDPVS